MHPTPAVPFLKNELFENFTLTEKALTFKWTIQPKCGVPAHYHKVSDELFEVIEGSLLFTLNGKKIHASAGDKVLVPHGAVHAVANKSTTPAVCTVSYTPPADQDAFMRASQFVILQKPELNGKMGMMLRAIYITEHLGFEEFSTPGSAFVRGISKVILGFIMLYGTLAGWKKLAADYSRSAVAGS